VYKSQTQPLIDYYKKKGLLIDIDGEREIDEVRSDIKKALERFQ
jgi:adenylate kinase